MKIKQPFETIDLAVAFAGSAPAAIGTVTVAAKGLVAVVTPLTVTGTAIAGSAVLVSLSGGTDGERYLVTVRATDAAGEAREAEAELGVVDFGWAVPVTTGYLTAQALVERLGLDETIRLTDEAGIGRIDTPRLANAITDAAAEADGYLAARFTTPIAPVPQLVATIVYDLAVARLYRGGLPADVKDRADVARDQLKSLAKGTMTLPGASAIAPAAASPTPVLVDLPERVFTRDSLKGF